jgi:hypothetical protein
MELGFDVVKTKDRPYWHRKNGEGGIGIPISIDDDEDDKNGDKPIDEKKEYPVFAIDNAPKELYDYDESGECTIRYKITRRSMIDKDGKPTYSVEMEVSSIDPGDKREKPAKKSSYERTKESSEAYNRASRK